MVLFTQEHPNLGSRLAAGALTGVIGGILMAMFEMFYHGAITQMGLFTMPNMIATLAGFIMHSDFGAYTMIGMMIHLIFSAFLGMIWGAVFTRTPNVPTSTLLGLIYGYVLYLIMFYAVTPWINPMWVEARGADQILAHLIFGVSFVLYPRFVANFFHRGAYR